MELRPTCYRHPDRAATISCQRCGKPICTDCMVPAPVGFQCPSCVSSGLRQTRQLEGRYGGVRTANPTLDSRVLIGTNVALWLAVVLTGWGSSFLVRLLALTPTGVCLVNDGSGRYFPDFTTADMCQALGGTTWAEGVASGAYWQLITSAFMHIDVWHIGFNMVALWILGPQLNAVLGRARFLALYFLSALAASTMVMWFSDPISTTLGASGAIFGLMGGVLIVVIKQRGDIRSIGFWIGANVVITVLAGSVISWQGHLGGLIGGAAIAAVIVYAPRKNRSLVQWSVIGVLAAMLAVLIVARIMMLG